MKLTLCIPLTLALCAILTWVPSASSQKASDGDQAIAAERKVWEAEKAKNLAALDSLLANDYVEIASGEGWQDRAAVIKELATIELKDYELTDMKASNVAPDVVLLTYHFHVTELHDGKPHPNDCAASSLWVRRGGQWKNVIFQETPDK